MVSQLRREAVAALRPLVPEVTAWPRAFGVF
jgi:hypothetical protein